MKKGRAVSDPPRFSKLAGQLSRALAPVAAEVVVAEAEPGRCRSPGSPIHPGTSASPEAAAEAAAVVAAAAAEPLPERQSSA